MFVFCMSPFSKAFNSKHQLVEIENDKGSYATNHLLFIDDIKLMAKEEDVCKSMLDETMAFFKRVGLEINKKNLLPTQIYAQT